MRDHVGQRLVLREQHRRVEHAGEPLRGHARQAEIARRQDDAATLRELALLRDFHGGAVAVLTGDGAHEPLGHAGGGVQHAEHGGLRLGRPHMPAEHAVGAAHVGSRAHHAGVALLDPDGLVAQTLDLVVVVRHDEHGDVVLLDELRDAALAFLLEHEVADREHLIDDEDLGHDDRGDGERDARDHA